MKHHPTQSHALLILMVGVISILLPGCSTPKGIIFEPVDPAINWPQPPEPARIRYIGSLRTDKDLKPAKSIATSIAESLFGEHPSRSMLTPFAVCADDKDRIFIVDSNAQLIHVYNLDTRSYQQWKPAENQPQLAQPIALAYDTKSNQLFVSDAALGAIHIFDAQGNSIGIFASEHLIRPSGIVFDDANDRIFVADIGAHQIVVLAHDGTLIRTLGTRGTQLGEFNFPTNLALSSDGSLYVSDSLNFRIQVFDSSLRPVRQIGEHGDLPGYFSHPKGIALDSDDNLYVIDSHFESVQIFDTQGTLLLTFGEEGHAPGQFWLPTGIHITADNRIWVADSYNQRLQVFQYQAEIEQ